MVFDGEIPVLIAVTALDQAAVLWGGRGISPPRPPELGVVEVTADGWGPSPA
ncbi:MAG TPA: hypothetical protein VES21_13085 [Nocardioidaceae bacterium]|nr:hypothetical protein [Nocardioidaceae bacterium]